jgi:dihydrodipicolinate synthase/N-acetylneuraminate lyase
MFTGTGTALVTPFRRDGSLDEPTLRALVKRQIAAGIDFLVPCGTTGECPTLTEEEQRRVVEITVELAKGKVPVLAGAGGYNTCEVIERARELAKHAGGSLSPLQGYCRSDRSADHSLQRSGTHRSEHRACNRAAVGAGLQHCRH